MQTRIFLYCSAAAAIAAALFTLRAFAAPQQSLDPLVVAPATHKLVYENQFVRVIEAKVPVGSKEPKHRHPHGITVYLADYEVEQKAFPGEKVSKGRRKFGTVSWSDAVVHEVTNVGKTNSHALRIELK